MRCNPCWYTCSVYKNWRSIEHIGNHTCCKEYGPSARQNLHLTLSHSKLTMLSVKLGFGQARLLASVMMCPGLPLLTCRGSRDDYHRHSRFSCLSFLSMMMWSSRKCLVSANHPRSTPHSAVAKAPLSLNVQKAHGHAQVPAPHMQITWHTIQCAMHEWQVQSCWAHVRALGSSSTSDLCFDQSENVKLGMRHI